MFLAFLNKGSNSEPEILWFEGFCYFVFVFLLQKQYPLILENRNKPREQSEKLPNPKSKSNHC